MLTSLSFFGWHRLRAIPILKRYNNVLWVSKPPLATKNPSVTSRCGSPLLSKHLVQLANQPTC